MGPLLFLIFINDIDDIDDVHCPVLDLSGRLIKIIIIIIIT